MRRDKPPLASVNGQILPWQQAQVHISSETALRGMNVFEGIRVYWNEPLRQWSIIEPSRHLSRLMRSTEILKFPSIVKPQEILLAIRELVTTLDLREDLYLRVTVFLESGGYSATPRDMDAHWYIIAYPVASNLQSLRPVSAIVSQWRKYPSNVFPHDVKAGGAYLLGRLPRIEAQERGSSEVIVLNTEGRVCETTGANIVIVRGADVKSPSLEEGPLDGITLWCLARLLSEHRSITINRGVMSVEELISADEVFTCGTLSEVCPVTNIDGLLIGSGQTGGLTHDVAALYAAHVKGAGLSNSPIEMEIVSVL